MSASSLSLQALIVAIALIIYIITSHVIEVKKIQFVHESAISIVMGLCIAAINSALGGNAVSFDQDLFFSIILPPIIFAAGYNLKKKKEFFHNFKLIMFYGIFGTLIVFFIVSAFAIGFNEMDIFFSTKLHIS